MRYKMTNKLVKLKLMMKIEKWIKKEKKNRMKENGKSNKTILRERDQR